MLDTYNISAISWGRNLALMPTGKGKSAYIGAKCSGFSV